MDLSSLSPQQLQFLMSLLRGGMMAGRPLNPMGGAVPGLLGAPPAPGGMMAGRPLNPMGGAAPGLLGAPPGGMPVGAGPPPISPQAALMQQLQNPQQGPMQQVIQRLAQLQQQQGQTLNAVSQPNPLLQQISPQVTAMLKLLNGQLPPGSTQAPPYGGGVPS